MADDALPGFLEQCGQLALERASAPTIEAGASAFLQALTQAEWRQPELRQVPVVSELSGLENPELGLNIGSIVDECSWTPSPRGNDDGVEVALCPLNVHLDLGDVIAGFLVAGAGRVYPEHNHPPQELYLMLSGVGSWRHGGNDHYESVSPGSTLYNPPGVTHSVRAGSEPVVAFYALWP